MRVRAETIKNIYSLMFVQHKKQQSKKAKLMDGLRKALQRLTRTQLQGAAEYQNLAPGEGSEEGNEDDDESEVDAGGNDGALGDQLLFMQEGGEAEPAKEGEEADKYSKHTKLSK